MKNRKTGIILAVCFGALLLGGCENEEKNIFLQAQKDLEQGSYEYALQGYEQSIQNAYNLAQSYRGAGIACYRMGNYEDSIRYFGSALQCERVSTSLKKDILSYRATACLASERLDEAMADCQTIAGLGDMDADSYFLAGKVALAMDSYEEAASNFAQTYAEESNYDMAIQIYQAYLEMEMEADGTRYLEAALASEAKTAADHCDRGRVYYYMDDFDNAQQELITASNDGNTEALILLGMVYLAKGDTSNARAMYQQYGVEEGESAKGYNGLALCDIADGNYDAALVNISSGKENASTEELQSLLYNEMVVYEKKLDFVTARQKAEEYLEMFPGNAEVGRELEFLKSRTM